MAGMRAAAVLAALLLLGLAPDVATAESGEAACEGKGLDKAACEAVGCCEYDSNESGADKCFSKVGAAECKASPAVGE